MYQFALVQIVSDAYDTFGVGGDGMGIHSLQRPKLKSTCSWAEQGLEAECPDPPGYLPPVPKVPMLPIVVFTHRILRCERGVVAVLVVGESFSLCRRRDEASPPSSLAVSSVSTGLEIFCKGGQMALTKRVCHEGHHQSPHMSVY